MRHIRLDFLVLAFGVLAHPSITHAQTAVRADPQNIAATRSSAAEAAANAPGAGDAYMLCAFYPKPGTCERIYRKAMTDKDIAAEAVRAEYAGYVKYLGGNGTLSETDRQYLRDNRITLPDGLSAADQSGLHNVINDPAFAGDADARRIAVNNFLTRAVEAELYCSFSNCSTPAENLAPEALESTPVPSRSLHIPAPDRRDAEQTAAGERNLIRSDSAVRAR